jgi:hypothetical protein
MMAIRFQLLAFTSLHLVISPSSFGLSLEDTEMVEIAAEKKEATAVKGLPALRAGDLMGRDRKAVDPGLEEVIHQDQSPDPLMARDQMPRQLVQVPS